MSITIKKDNCVSCKKCGKVCPGSLIKFGDDHKAYIKYPEECWGCSSCLKECSFGAIAFYLGADMGGMGSKLIVSVDDETMHWKIEKSNGETTVIDVNPKDSNKY